MKANFIIIIICSGAGISLLGLLVLLLPVSNPKLIARYMECILTLPPISVASYILVFKYHEKFRDTLPPADALLSKIIQGSVAAFVFFFLMAMISSLLYRLMFAFNKTAG